MALVNTGSPAVRAFTAICVFAQGCGGCAGSMMAIGLEPWHFYVHPVIVRPRKVCAHMARGRGGCPSFSHNTMFLRLFFEVHDNVLAGRIAASASANRRARTRCHDAAKMIAFAHGVAMAGPNRPGKDFSFRDLPSGAYSRDVRL